MVGSGGPLPRASRDLASSAVAQDCYRCPSCLDPSQSCLGPPHTVFQVLPECIATALLHNVTAAIRPEENPLCRRSMFNCPTTGVLVSLPLLTNEELGPLYDKHYTGQAANPKKGRWEQQAKLISQFTHGRRNLTVVEMGCGHGYMLSHLATRAQFQSIICFEPDGKMMPDLTQAFRRMPKDVRATVVPALFTDLDAGVDVAPDSSVDVFASSHVLEHVADPCEWLGRVRRILRPGGIVFTEIPTMWYNFSSSQPSAAGGVMFRHDRPISEAFTLSLHISFFGGAPFHTTIKSPFERMMEMGGFQNVAARGRGPVEASNATARYMFRYSRT